MKIKLSKAIVLSNNEQVAELNVDVNSLTGNDIIIAERNAGESAGGQLMTAHIAARAARVPVEAILNLPLPDFIKALRCVNVFFGEQALEPENAVKV